MFYIITVCVLFIPLKCVKFTYLLCKYMFTKFENILF